MHAAAVSSCMSDAIIQRHALGRHAAVGCCTSKPKVWSIDFSQTACFDMQVYRERLKADVEGRPYQLPPASTMMASAATSAALPPRNRSFTSSQAAESWDDWGGSGSNRPGGGSMKVLFFSRSAKQSLAGVINRADF